MHTLRVWDLPVRLCHWLLAVAMVAAFVTAKIGGPMMVWHGRAGIAIVGLLAFRVAWGLVGSDTARFAGFVRGPGAILAYLRGQWRGIGHNPLGALSVLGMLGALALQAATGLLANDDIAFQGPLAALAGDTWSNRARWLHGTLQYLTLALVALHVLAIVYYVRVRRENLVRPMVTGWASVAPDRMPAARARAGLVALVLASLFAATVAYGAAGGFLPPAPAATPSAPAW